MKLFGSKHNSEHAQDSDDVQKPQLLDKLKLKPKRKGDGENAEKKGKKPRDKKKILISIVSILLVLVGLYTFVVYTNVPFIKNLREAYIETAMSTMTHQWLAEAFFPQSVIDEVMDKVKAERAAQIGIESKWDEDKQEKGNSTIYDIFDELDKASFEAYLKAHPEENEITWKNIKINEAGLDDDGTSIVTKQGDQVLALDVRNGILIVRIEGSGYQGVMAILKNPEDLRCCAAEKLGFYGEFLGDLVTRCNGILGVNASGFSDKNGGGSGGQVKGFMMCSGVEYGKHFDNSRKRLELRTDDKLYIVDASTETHPDTRDAAEFRPALIVDGVSLIGEQSAFRSIQPRTVVGQSRDGDILLLVIEGRLVGRSLGIGMPECALIMSRYDAYQAMNMDGGTSSVMWYDGEYITKCSNPAIYSRYLPNAWVYGNAA